MKKLLLEVGELAKIIKVAESTIYNWIQTEKLPVGNEFGVVIDLGTYKIRTNLFEKKYNVDLSDEFLTFKDIKDVFKSPEGTIRSWKHRNSFPENFFTKIEGCVRVQKSIWDRFLLGEALDGTSSQQVA